jgi:hypothetical protein
LLGKNNAKRERKREIYQMRERERDKQTERERKKDRETERVYKQKKDTISSFLFFISFFLIGENNAT